MSHVSVCGFNITVTATVRVTVPVRFRGVEYDIRRHLLQTMSYVVSNSDHHSILLNLLSQPFSSHCITLTHSLTHSLTLF